MPQAPLVDVDFSNRLNTVIRICTLTNAQGHTVPVPNQAGTFDLASDMLPFLAAAAAAMGASVRTNIDYTGFQPYCNEILAKFP